MTDPPKRAVPPVKTVRLEPTGFQAEVVQALKAPHRPVLVVLSGPEVGLRARVEGSVAIGRDPSGGMCLTDVGVSWIHARLEDRGDAWALIDVGSTNGTLVNGSTVSDHVLAPGDKIQIGNTVIRFEVQDGADQAYDEMVRQMIEVDDLTGLLQRRRFDQELAVMLHAAGEARRPVGMMVMDLDGVKRINDTHGHLFGAHTIAEAGRVIGQVLGDRGIAARFGGDEFVAATSGTDLESVRAVAEEIRAAVKAHRYEREGVVLEPGISIGIAAFPESASDPTSLFHAADGALYRAKNDGKNCVRS